MLNVGLQVKYVGYVIYHYDYIYIQASSYNNSYMAALCGLYTDNQYIYRKK